MYEFVTFNINIFFAGALGQSLRLDSRNIWCLCCPRQTASLNIQVTFWWYR